MKSRRRVNSDVMSLQTKSHQDKFLSDVIFGITLAGTAQRGNLYRHEASTDERNQFRLALRCALETIAEQYRGPVADALHLANINDLARTLSKRHRKALTNGRFRIGSAQKALNLHLKMLWCLDRISTPPHCPFDRIVLSHVPGCEGVNWTQFDSLAEYLHIVRCARAAANGLEDEMGRSRTAVERRD